MNFLRNNYYKTVAVHIVFWLVFIFYSGFDNGYYHHDHWSFRLQPDCVVLTRKKVNYLVFPYFRSNSHSKKIFCPAKVSSKALCLETE